MLSEWGRTRQMLFVVMTSFWYCDFAGADDKRPGCENAALHYWVAFDLCSELRQNVRVQRATVYTTETGFGVPVTEELARVLNDRVEKGLTELHRGSKLSKCNWSTDFRADGLFIVAPHGEKAHGLARVSLLRARWRFERNEWEKGIDDVIATFVLARHIGSDEYWANIHFGCMLETMCTSTIAVYLLQMPESARDELAKRIDSIPKFTSMREAILKSEELIEWAIEGANQADHAQRLKEFVSQLLSGDKDLLKKIANQTETLDDVVKLIESVRPLVRKLADATTLPPAEYERHYRDHLESEFKRNPLAIVLINADAYGCRSEESAAHCRLEALKTAIDIQRRGKLALEDHPDPYGAGPFGYLEMSNGYQLTSEFRYTGKTKLNMIFGSTKASP